MEKLHRGLKQFVVFVIACLIIIGCEPANSVLNKKFRYFSEFPKEDAIVSKNICEYKEGIAGMLKLVDSTLIVFNVQPGVNNVLNSYSLKSGALSNGYYIYDWDGNPIRKLILNKYIQGMAVSKDNKTLYAFDVNTGFLIRATIN